MAIIASQTSSVFNKTPPPHLGPGWTNLPSAFNLFFIHEDFVSSCKDILASKRLGDREGLVDNGLRTLNAPLNLTCACYKAISIAFQIFSYWGTLKDLALSPLMKLFNKIAPIVGLPMCAVEAVIEGVGLNRSLRMINRLGLQEIDQLKQLKGSGKYLKDYFIKQLKAPTLFQTLLSPDEFTAISHEVRACNDPQTPYKLLTPSEKTQLNTWRQKLEDRLINHRLNTLAQKYHLLAPKKAAAIDYYVQNILSHFSPEGQLATKKRLTENALAVQHRELIRRVYPTAAKEIQEALPQLVQNVPHSVQARDDAYQLLHCIKTQSQKSALIHTLGLIAVVLTIIGVSIALGGLPIIIASAIFILAGLISCVRYTLHKGLIHTKGWNFDYENCIPKPLKYILQQLEQTSQEFSRHAYLTRLSTLLFTKIISPIVKLLIALRTVLMPQVS